MTDAHTTIKTWLKIAHSERSFFILMFGYDLIKQSPSDFPLLLVKL